MKYIALAIMILAFISCAEKKTAQEYFNEGAQFVQKGEIDKGIEYYNKGLKLEATSAVGYNLLGMAYRFKFNQTQDPKWRTMEIENFKKALKINPDFMPALINIGATYYYSGEKKKAVPYLKHALEVTPDHPEAEDIRKMIEEAEGTEESK